jgi:hypothetical protein
MLGFIEGRITGLVTSELLKSWERKIFLIGIGKEERL